MKKVLLAGVISSLMWTSVYAINLPTSSTDKNKPYGDASFVSKPSDESPSSTTTPNVKPATTKSTEQTKQAVDSVSTLPPNQATMLSEANAAPIQVAATHAVKTAAGCPVTCPQKTAIIVKKELIQKIVTRQINSSNAHEIEQLLGPACSCITFNPLSAEVWTCQWKGDLSSNRLENTINVTFEGGMLANVTAVRGDGVTYMAQPNQNVTVYQPQ